MNDYTSAKLQGFDTVNFKGTGRSGPYLYKELPASTPDRKREYASHNQKSYKKNLGCVR